MNAIMDLQFGLSQLELFLCDQAMMVVAHKSNAEEIGILRKVFQNYDTNKSGDITCTSVGVVCCFQK